MDHNGKLYIETVGCQMNVLDSELVVAALRKQGYREAGRDHWIEARDGSFVSFVTFAISVALMRRISSPGTHSAWPRTAG